MCSSGVARCGPLPPDRTTSRGPQHAAQGRGILCSSPASRPWHIACLNGPVGSTRSRHRRHSPAIATSDVPRSTRGPRADAGGSNRRSTLRNRQQMKTGSSLELAALTKLYGSTVAVDAIDLRVPADSYCCLLGPSGCGKTSTLRMIAGHETASSGDILLGERNVTDLAPAQRGTAMMFQSYALFPHLTAADNVAFSLKMRGSRRPSVARKALDMLELVDMTRYAERLPGAALRRPAAARGAGARADHRAAGPAARRAALGARPVPAHPGARRAEAPAEGARHHLRPRHAHPGRGDGARRPHRGDEPRPDRAGRHRRARSSTRRAPRSSRASWAATT